MAAHENAPRAARFVRGQPFTRPAAGQETEAGQGTEAGSPAPPQRLAPAYARGVIDCHTAQRPCGLDCTDDEDCPRYRWAVTMTGPTTDQAAEGAAGEE